MNARLQETREQAAESMLNHQQIRMKLTRRIAAVTNLVAPERMRAVFNTEDHEVIWEQ
jgi:hypothetical protein